MSGPGAQVGPGDHDVAWRDSGWRWLPLTVLAIVLDQASKRWIEHHYDLFETQVITPQLDIVRAHNTGAAFSFLADAGGWQRWLFTALALGVGVAIFVWLRGINARKQVYLAAGLALILGGALGNVFGRIEYGYVIDFIQVHWHNAYFPAFNVADSAITLGAMLLLFDAWREWRQGAGSGKSA